VTVAAEVEVLDLATTSLRELNQRLHDAEGGRFQVVNPSGAHAVACGLDGTHEVEILGLVG
jgi:methylamine---glutamate N-methyltransferase subunit B